MLEGVEAEVALLNSGTLRSDRVHPRGEFRMRDLLAILPMVDPVVVINITGRVGRWGGGAPGIHGLTVQVERHYLSSVKRETCISLNFSVKQSLKTMTWFFFLTICN